jgi:twitching motility protein PilT
VPTADGTGRVPVCEVLTASARVHDAILDPETSADLRDIISEGGYYGMQTFDQALYERVTSGEVDLDEALQWATRPHDFKLLIAAGGHLSATMEEVDRVALAAASAHTAPSRQGTGQDGGSRSAGVGGATRLHNRQWWSSCMSIQKQARGLGC